MYWIFFWISEHCSLAGFFFEEGKDLLKLFFFNLMKKKSFKKSSMNVFFTL